MTVYNVNLGIGWASSGVEYAQSYRNQSFKKMRIKAKFIYSDLILANNIQDLTSNLGFHDNQIIWLYNFFTDVKIAPSSYSLQELEEKINLKKRSKGPVMVGNEARYEIPAENLMIAARLHDKKKLTIDQVTYVFNNQIIKRDFYSYTKYACEYYFGVGPNNRVAFREFYNEDGSIAYIQHLNGDEETFEFPNHHIFYSKNELYLQMVKKLHLTKRDIVIMDREDEDKHLINGQIFFENHGNAKLVVVVHADHYDKHYTNENTILWNNFYEYQFTHSSEVASYIVATEKQREILKKQFKIYQHEEPQVDCIPVGSLAKLNKPKKKRKPFSLITASRLAGEKHIDWLIKAVINAKPKVPELSLDIYGKGGEVGKLQKLIDDNHAGEYIHLMGQHDLTDVYVNYASYIAASTSEGFGLSLLEAIGSGLAMIGFDVPYGNPTFIDNGKNGYLLPYNENWTEDKKCQVLTNAIIKLFESNKIDKFSNRSYEIAEKYLTDNVAKEWKKVLGDLNND